MADHVGGDLEDDAGLLPVGRAPVYLGGLLPVPARQQQRDRGSQLGLTLLLGDLHIRGGELAVAIGFDGAEQVAHDLFLPTQQRKRCACPAAFRVAQRLNERDGEVGFALVVGRACGHEPGRLIRARHRAAAPSSGHKKSPNHVGRNGECGASPDPWGSGRCEGLAVGGAEVGDHLVGVEAAVAPIGQAALPGQGDDLVGFGVVPADAAERVDGDLLGPDLLGELVEDAEGDLGGSLDLTVRGGVGGDLQVVGDQVPGGVHRGSSLALVGCGLDLGALLQKS